MKTKKVFSVEIVWQGHSIRGAVEGYGWEDVTSEVLQYIEVYVEDENGNDPSDILEKLNENDT